MLWQIPQFSQRLLWPQKGRQRRYSKPQNGLQVAAGKLEQGPRSNTLRDLEKRVTPSMAGKEKAEGTAALRGRRPASFPFKKSSRMYLRPLSYTVLMVTNRLHLSFLSHSTRFKENISIESYLFNPFNLFKDIFCVCYSVLIFRLTGLNFYCRRAWSVSFQCYFIEGKSPPGLNC